MGIGYGAVAKWELKLPVIIHILGDYTIEIWAGLHDNVPADVLPRWQRLPVACHSAQMHWRLRLDDNFCRAAPLSGFWRSDSFNFKCHSRQLTPNRCHLGGESVWDVTLSWNQALASVVWENGSRVERAESQSQNCWQIRIINTWISYGNFQKIYIIFSQSDDLALYSRSQLRLKLDTCLTCTLISGQYLSLYRCHSNLGWR